MTKNKNFYAVVYICQGSFTLSLSIGFQRLNCAKPAFTRKKLTIFKITAGAEINQWLFRDLTR
jgi:hypothetical protein